MIWPRYITLKWYVQIYTIKANFSYEQNSAAINSLYDEQVLDPVSNVLNSLNVGIQNINAAPIVFQALAVEHASDNLAELQKLVLSHYKMEATRNIFSVVGRMGLLGNPGAALSAFGGGSSRFHQ